MGGVVAAWDPSLGDPRGRPVKILLSWHDGSGVEATGTVTSVEQSEPTGALVTLTDLIVVEPSTADVTARRTGRDLALRSVTATGPAACFGETIPAVGQRISIDLNDARLAVRRSTPPEPHVSSGVVRQISELRPTGLIGVAACVRIEPGTPTADVTSDLLVELVLDE